MPRTTVVTRIDGLLGELVAPITMTAVMMALGFGPTVSGTTVAVGLAYGFVLFVVAAVFWMKVVLGAIVRAGFLEDVQSGWITRILAQSDVRAPNLALRISLARATYRGR